MNEQRKPNFFKEVLTKTHRAISPIKRLQAEIKNLNTELETEISFAQALNYTPDVMEKESYIKSKKAQLAKLEGVSLLSSFKSKASNVFSRANIISKNLGRKIGAVALASLTQFTPVAALTKEKPVSITPYKSEIYLSQTEKAPHYQITSVQQIEGLVKANKLPVGATYTIGNLTYTIKGDISGKKAPNQVTIDTISQRLQDHIKAQKKIQEHKALQQNPLSGTRSVATNPVTQQMFFPNPQVEQTGSFQLKMPQIAKKSGEFVTFEAIKGNPITFQRPNDISSPELKNTLRPIISVGAVEALGVNNPNYSPTLAFTKKIIQNYIQKGDYTSARKVIDLIRTTPNMASPGFIENPYQFVVTSKAVVNYFTYSFPSEILTDQELTKNINKIPVDIDQTQFVAKLQNETKQHLMSTAATISQNISLLGKKTQRPELIDFVSGKIIKQASDAKTVEEQNIIIYKLISTSQYTKNLRTTVASSLKVRINELNRRIDIANKYQSDIEKLLGEPLTSTIDLKNERYYLQLLSANFGAIDRILTPQELEQAKNNVEKFDNSTIVSSREAELEKQKRIEQYRKEQEVERVRLAQELDAQRKSKRDEARLNKAYQKAFEKSPSNLTKQPAISPYVVPDKVTVNQQLNNLIEPNLSLREAVTNQPAQPVTTNPVQEPSKPIDIQPQNIPVSTPTPDNQTVVVQPPAPTPGQEQLTTTQQNVHENLPQVNNIGGKIESLASSTKNQLSDPSKQATSNQNL